AGASACAGLPAPRLLLAALQLCGADDRFVSSAGRYRTGQGNKMAPIRGDAPVTLSLLDRLIDEDLKRSGDAHLTRSQSVRKLRDAVRRDLEWLLNTRQPIIAAADGSELQGSLYM